MMQLFHLGIASDIIYPFSKEGNSIFKKVVKPTLSPKDPNFPTWWEQHKKEWEEPKKDGQEPADD